MTKSTVNVPVSTVFSHVFLFKIQMSAFLAAIFVQEKLSPCPLCFLFFMHTKSTKIEQMYLSPALKGKDLISYDIG